VCITLSLAQFKQKDVELSLSGSFNSWKTSSTGSGQTNSSERTIGILSGSAGYFVVDGLSLEGEVGIVAVEDEDAAQYVLAGISYTSLSPGSNIAPFVHAGYGISNAVQYPMLGGAPMKITDEMDVKVLNLGGGLKYLVNPWAALRLELNYRTHSWSRENTYYGYSSPYTSKTDYQYANLGVMLGFAVLL